MITVKVMNITMELVSLFSGIRPSVLTGWETNPPKPHFRWVLGLFGNSFTLYNIIYIIIYIAIINNGIQVHGSGVSFGDVMPFWRLHNTKILRLCLSIITVHNICQYGKNIHKRKL